MSKKLIFAIVVLIVVVGAIAVKLTNRKTPVPQSHPTYSLNLMSGKTYGVNAPEMLHFNIQDQTGKVLKDFDTVHEKKLHLIVVRADRTNFQHVHPELDTNTGKFMLENFKFPTDGPYRVFADFTASSAQKDASGMKLAATPYQDVAVGSAGKYLPQTFAEDKLASSANGLETKIFFPPGDDSVVGGALVDYYAGQTNMVNVVINQNHQSYTKLQPYLGALGHMVVLGPNLEFIHAHPLASDFKNQNGLISFQVTPPIAGRYRLFLQTQASGQVNTTDYAITVQKMPGSSANSANPMMHSGH